MLQIGIIDIDLFRETARREAWLDQKLGAVIENGVRAIVTGKSSGGYKAPKSLAEEAKRLAPSASRIKAELMPLRAAYAYSGANVNPDLVYGRDPSGKKKLVAVGRKLRGAKKKILESRVQQIGHTSRTLSDFAWAEATSSRTGTQSSRQNRVKINTRGESPLVEFRSRQAGVVHFDKREKLSVKVMAANRSHLVRHVKEEILQGFEDG